MRLFLQKDEILFEIWFLLRRFSSVIGEKFVSTIEFINLNRHNKLYRKVGEKMKRVLYFFSLVVFGLFFGISAQAENIYVEDDANVLSSETKEEIYQYNQRYKELALRPELAVVTLNKLPDDESIEGYANEKFNTLGIGAKEYDSGILYVIAVDDRQQRIEVGYGLEGEIPDALAMDLMIAEVKVYFREENYDAGVNIIASNINQILIGRKTIKDFE